MTHTPGPWTAYRFPQTQEERYLCSEAVWNALSVSVPINAGSDVVAMAARMQDARLIAAAPDMLAACQRILRAVRWSVTEDRMTPDQQADVLSAAIAKATGEEVTK